MRLIHSSILWYQAAMTSICNVTPDAKVPRVTSMSYRSSISHKITWSDCRSNLKNFSAVTIYLARVVQPKTTKIVWRGPGLSTRMTKIVSMWSCRTPPTLVAVRRSSNPVRQDPPDLSCSSFLTFLHHGIADKERHLLWKFHKQIQRKSWSNAQPKFLARLHKVSKESCTQNRTSPNVQWRSGDWINFFTVWTIYMKLGTLVHHVHGYKYWPQFSSFF